MLVSDLQNQFPKDTIEITDKDEELLAQFVDLIDGPEQAAEVPCDIRGTKFQIRKWDALQTNAELAGYRWGVDSNRAVKQ